MSNPAATPSVAEDVVGDGRWMSLVRYRLSDDSEMFSCTDAPLRYIQEAQLSQRKWRHASAKLFVQLT